MNACVFGSAKCVSECTLCVCVCVYCTSYERLCVHCVYGSFADNTLSAHGTLRVLQTAHLVHTVHYVLYKREFLS